MMNKPMKIRLSALIATCALAFMLWANTMTAFAATAKVTFSDPSVTVGSTVTVTMKVAGSSSLASADVMLSYDSGVLEFVSGTDAAGGGAGAIRIHGDGGTSNTDTMTFSLQFRALTAGTTKISITSQEIYDTASQLVTLEHQGTSTVTVGALQSASKDATLKSLQVSPGNLTPEFSPDVDTYAVTVGTDVEKLVISAECTDGNATNVVSGNENLQMGENRVSCKVVAQDGETSKEYIIVVTKEEGGASAALASGAEQFKMRVSERSITVLEPDESVEIPEGFKESIIKIDGHEVKGWVWGAETEHQYCVIYGMNEAGEKNFYRYDMKDTERTIQRYFADPAAEGAVTEEVYNQLAQMYDEMRGDYNLFRALLIAAIVIAAILLVLLIVIAFGRKNGRGPGGDGRRGRIRTDGSDEEEPYEDDSYDEDYPEEGLESEDDEAGEYEEDPLDEEAPYEEPRPRRNTSARPAAPAGSVQGGRAEVTRSAAPAGSIQGGRAEVTRPAAPAGSVQGGRAEVTRPAAPAGSAQGVRPAASARQVQSASGPAVPVSPAGSGQNTRPAASAPTRPTAPQPANPVAPAADDEDDFEIFDL